MSLERWRLAKLNEGNITAAKLAEVLIEQYGDVSLPSQPDILPTAEVRSFSGEAKKALVSEGYLIYPLTGQSINSLRGQGRKFWSGWHQSYPEFESLTSRLSEVAINPDPKKFFLPKSNSKTLDQQEGLIKKFSGDLAKEIPGVTAVLGETPDYAELVFRHLDATGEYLFGEKYGFDYTRTKTLVGSGVADVGYFNPHVGLGVNDWDADVSHGDVWAVPLVVPVETR